MTNKELAKFAKGKGFEQIATIVKSHFNSNYYNLNSVDSIIKTGKFDPAPVYNGFAHGVIESQLPGKCVTRTALRYMYNNK